MAHVWHVNGGSKGVPWARFTYDGLGRMVSAVYHDYVAGGDTSKSADEIFGAETIEYYVYDQHWRVTEVWRAGAVLSTGARPPAWCYERFVYASAGLNGRGDAYLLDCPVLSQIDADGDGDFERQRKYLQNSRGDVIGVQELDVYTPDECIRYTVYGYPELIPQPDPYHSADFNGDGDVGTDADINAFWACLGGHCCPTCGSLDVNRDGSVGNDPDITAFYDILNGNIATPPPSLSDNRFGFRGYWWDDHLKLYHVRHRVYDPVSFRWLQPDPAGFVDGLNLYAYCGGDPVNGIDPFGLDRWAWYNGWGDTFGDLLGFGDKKDVKTVRNAAKDGIEDGKDIIANATVQVITLGGLVDWVPGAQDLRDQHKKLMDEWGGEFGYQAANVAAYTANVAVVVVVAVITWEAVGGSTASVTIGRTADGALHIVFGADGALVHGVGTGAGVIVTDWMATTALVGTTVTISGIPVISAVAVVATGVTAGSCAGAAGRGILRGWFPWIP